MQTHYILLHLLWATKLTQNLLAANFSLSPSLACLVRYIHIATLDVESREKFTSLINGIDLFCNSSADTSWHDLAILSREEGVERTQDVPFIRELCELIYSYACENLGRSALKKWQRDNKDKSLLEHITPQDIAYTLLVLQAYVTKWDQELDEDEDTTEGNTSSESESDSSHSATPDSQHKKKRRRIEPKSSYLKGSRKKMKLYETGWTQDAVKYYTTTASALKKLKEDVMAWDECKEGWEAYLLDKRSSGEECWVPRFLCHQNSYLNVMDDAAEDEYYIEIPFEEV